MQGAQGEAGSSGMSKPQYQAAQSMYAALRSLPCRCEHNVPYAECKVEQHVTKMCARCSSMAAWEAALEV